ncbi:3-keto-5-aminohexanoate cleavage protein [soil metagenome]
MEPLIITVAGVGAEITKDQQPGLPTTPDELALDATRCAEAGASIYHLHVRDERGRPTMDVQAFREAHAAITSAGDLIVQFTSGGAVTDREEARIAPLELRPEMASLTTGTVNFGDDVFSNPMPLVRRFYARMRTLGIVPEFEIFEAGMIANAVTIAAEGDGHHQHFDLVLGVPGAMPAWSDSLEFLVEHLPEGATWSATGIGRSHLPVTERAIELGGHVRTGFEDVRYFGPGELASSNAQLISRVACLARARGREIATPGEARAHLGLAE